MNHSFQLFLQWIQSTPYASIPFESMPEIDLVYPQGSLAQFFRSALQLDKTASLALNVKHSQNTWQWKIPLFFPSHPDLPFFRDCFVVSGRRRLIRLTMIPKLNFVA